jgi:hypothetical protein
MIATDTNNETKNQTQILIDFIKGTEKNRERQNNTTQKILSALHHDSEVNTELLDRMEAESKAKQQLLDNQAVQIIYLKNQTAQNQIIIHKLENLSEQILNVTLDTNNITDRVDTSLYLYGENSVKELKVIKNNTEKILSLLSSR